MSKFNRALRAENAKHPESLRRIWSTGEPKPLHVDTRIFNNNGRPVIAIYRSRRFLVVAYQETPAIVWLSVNRAERVGNRWADGITWDELQRIKRECGYGDRDAVEIYPRDCDVVDVANIRHLWVFLDALVGFAWRKDTAQAPTGGAG